jgi:hypothetical protein
MSILATNTLCDGAFSFSLASSATMRTFFFCKLIVTISPV